MKVKLLITLVAIAMCGLTAKAQDSLPNYLLAGELQMIVSKLGLPVDSLSKYLDGFSRMDGATPSETVFKSGTVFISIDSDANGLSRLIKCFMPATLLSTAQKAITMMGMIASNTQAPAGYTAYATPKYAAFLNPQIKEGYLSLVMMQGGK